MLLPVVQVGAGALLDRNGTVSALVLAQHNDTGHIDSISIVQSSSTVNCIESRLRLDSMSSRLAERHGIPNAVSVSSREMSRSRCTRCP